ncbi:MAG: copper transporter [Bacteroidetes bacterium RIFCSPLOWO2_12_FULL_35_15]|nr:MAG: copper transporter [Bacteroidetes bacterium RIFCSPLOWO2_12_FULL_35_15]
MNFKEFKPSSWAIDNKISIYVLTIIITIVGLFSYNSLPKESFPDIVIPTIYINTVYQGNSPTNIENLVTKPIEKQLKSISGIKKINSTSLQDISIIMVEFNTGIDVPVAKQKVKDAIDKAQTDLPKDLTAQPNVMDVNLSEMPIMYVNIAGDMDLNKLKKYSDALKDRIESMKEITKVVMVGDLEREIQINVNMYKLQAANLSLGDIGRALKSENMNISGGLVPIDGMKRNLTIKAEFKTVEEIKNLVINSQTGAKLYLKDFAEVVDGNKEQESYARLEGKNVITLNIVKRSGENLIEASDKINATIKEMQEKNFPKDLKITVTGDQSEKTRSTLHDLINTIIIGFVLVTFILMFFMGVTNALFVAASVPLSMFIAFMFMPALGGVFGFSYTMNMIVLFAFLLALGIVVDDAIVVIENTHRLFENGKREIKSAAKMAAGEVFLPVLSGTLTTLAPFIPLLFWKGIIGKFMFYLPVTLIITLLASLFVAYIINPVFAVDFMKSHDEEKLTYGKLNRTGKIRLILYGLAAIFSYVGGHFAIGNFIIFLGLFMLFHRFFLFKAIEAFQFKAWPAFRERYTRFLLRFLKRPWLALLGTLGLFLFAIAFFIIRSPKVDFFPKGDPNFVYVYVKLPVGTDPAKTNQVMLQVEKKVHSVLGDSNKIVKSVITNVTRGTTDPQDQDQNNYPNRGKIAISFVSFEKREGKSTTDYLGALQKYRWNIPGAEITVNQEQAGPPVSKPINIEVRGDAFVELINNSTRLKQYLNAQHIGGIENLKSDFESNKPEIVFNIDRERANREGISTGQIAMEIRNAVFGIDGPSKFRDANDEYPIQVRYQLDQRNNIEAIRNLKINFRDMNMGGILRSVPLSAFCDIQYSNTYDGIKRKMQKRVITLSSNVSAGYNENEVVGKIKKSLALFKPSGKVEIALTGQQEEQAETGAFLGRALLISIGLMLFILVLQFNSFGKPIIILSEIFFSIIGVLIGTALFKMNMSIVMTGVGIIALGGVVVRNGILLIEFAEMARGQGMSLWNATVEAGRTRMTPVILTATAAILGLLPLAVGFNIDFETLFSHGQPHIYFGGDSVVFWGPLAWTMIFGLAFATFLTLLLVPAMYLISERLKRKAHIILKHLGLSNVVMYVPFFILITRFVFWLKGTKLEYGDLDY